MKKLIPIISLLFVFSSMPLSAGAETVTAEKGAENWSGTYICGDVNCDGDISIADMVGLQKYLLRGEKEENYSYDVNFDGKANVYDMTELRKNILNPKKALKMNFSIDIIENIDDSVLKQGTVIKTSEELESILDGIADTEKYTSKYDDEFFSKNNLLLGKIIQTFGEGVMYTVGNPARIAEYEYNGEKFSGIAIPVSGSYESDKMLYPRTDTVLLAQAALPKNICSEDTCFFADMSEFLSPDYSSYYYASPDKKHEYYITQSSFLLMSDVNVYIDNHDGTFEHICSLETDDGHNAFDDKGEWITDENGNNVFTNGESYKFTWYDDRVIIDYTWEDNKWTSETIYF